MIKAVFFDWDGTLYDIVDFIVETYTQVMREKGVREWSKDEYREKFKIDWRETLEDMDLKEHKDYLIDVWEANMEEMKNELRLHEDAREAINKLAEEHTIGIVSSAPWKALWNEVNRLDLVDKITIIVSGDDTKDRKPSPEPLNYAMGRLELKPEECIYVGDMVEDIISARKAGMKSVAVSWGLHTRDKLQEAKPDYLADSFKQLTDYIKSVEQIM